MTAIRADRHVVVEDDGVADFLFFFFQAEDGIRDHCVTGVQTCALPISSHSSPSVARPSSATSDMMRKYSARCSGSLSRQRALHSGAFASGTPSAPPRASEIGRASCRERV